MTAETVAIVVPTRNSARTLEACLRSLRGQSYPTEVIVVDNHSTDGTGAAAGTWSDTVIVAGPERSRQRNVGAAASRSWAVGFIDSDMVLEPNVVEEAVELLRGGAAGVIVPERTVGTGFWSRVREFERSFYSGSDGVEAARFFPMQVFTHAGGFDEALLGGEDWDLTIRVRRFGRIERSRAGIVHDEGVVRYRSACAKKAYYASGLQGFVRKHGMGGLRVGMDRPWLRRPWLIVVPHPLLGLGLIALKLGEALAISARLVSDSGRNLMLRKQKR